MLEEDEEVKYFILYDKMNYLLIFIDLFKEINEKCDVYDLFDYVSYIL